MALKESPGDVGLCSIDLRLDASRSAKKAEIGRNDQKWEVLESADVWHRCLGHSNHRSIKSPRTFDNNEKRFTAAKLCCDINAMGKQQTASGYEQNHIIAPRDWKYEPREGGGTR